MGVVGQTKKKVTRRLWGWRAEKRVEGSIDGNLGKQLGRLDRRTRGVELDRHEVEPFQRGCDVGRTRSCGR